jgi:hypothetical protein
MGVPDETGKAALVERKKTFDTIASFKGRFYFDESADTMGTLEFIGDGGDQTESRFGDMDVGCRVEFPDGSAAADMFMLESGGELFHVCVFYTLPCLDAPSGFAVYKMDLSEPAWRKTDDIGDRVFLLQGVFSALLGQRVRTEEEPGLLGKQPGGRHLSLRFRSE